jgi:hypothetical protein
VKNKQEVTVKCCDCKNYITGRYYDPVCYHVVGFEGKAYAKKIQVLLVTGLLSEAIKWLGLEI